MKHLNKILFFVLVLFTFTLSVNAANFSTTMTSNKSSITAGQQFTVTVGVKGAKDLYGLTASLSYDSSKVKFVSSNGQSGFAATVGSKLVVDAAAPKSGTFKVVTLTFKAQSGFSVGQSTTIKISGVEGSDGAALLTGNGSSVTIKMEAPKSSNNYLKSLSLSDGTIKFNRSTNSYKVTVDYKISSIKITAEAEDEKAKISGTGTHELNIYNNDLKVVVTAENGSARTYTITVVRKDKDGNSKELSSDVTLSSLKIDGYTLVFDTNVKEYTVLLKDTKLLNIVAIPNNEGATVEVVNPGAYQTGNNVIKVKVIAENGAVEEYTINAVLAKEVKAQKVTCEKSDCSHGLVMLVSILGTLLVCIGAFFGFAKAGYIKVKTSATKTKLERTLVKKDEDTSKKD